MLVRFTTKKHGPVAVANVDDAKVELALTLIPIPNPNPILNP